MSASTASTTRSSADRRTSVSSGVRRAAAWDGAAEATAEVGRTAVQSLTCPTSRRTGDPRRAPRTKAALGSSRVARTRRATAGRATAGRTTGGSTTAGRATAGTATADLALAGRVTTDRPAASRRTHLGASPVRHARLTRRGRLLLLVALVGVLLGAFSLGRSVSQAAPRAEAAPAMDSAASTAAADQPLPEQVTVQQGESLWTVALRSAPDQDPRDVVAQIRRLNELSSAELWPGQQLLLPAVG